MVSDCITKDRRDRAPSPDIAVIESRSFTLNPERKFGHVIIENIPMLNRLSRAYVALTLLLCLSPSLLAGSDAKRTSPRKNNLAEQINSNLSQPPLDRAHWGIDVVDLDSGKTLYAQNPDQLFLPASNTKLFTTAAALAIAGPDYRFRTTVEAEGKIDDHGRLPGDLVIVGRGDPEYLRAHAALCPQNRAHAAAYADPGRDGGPGGAQRLEDRGWRPDRRRHVTTTLSVTLKAGRRTICNGLTARRFRLSASMTTWFF